MLLGRWVALTALTVAGTLALTAAAVPSPALFGALLAAAALALAGYAPAAVPRPAFTLAQAVIGVVIGVLVQTATLVAVARDWLPVLLVAAATLAASMAAGLLLGRVRGVTPVTGVLALTAGGASGLVAVSRELGGDERVVAVVQYLRVGLVTATMPVVAALVFAAGPPEAPAAAPSSWPAGLAVTAVSVAAGVPLARLARLPAGGLLGPMVVALGLTLAGLADGGAPPDALVQLAYVAIGWHAGIGFTRESMRTVARLLPAATGLIVAVVAACAALGAGLSALTGVSPLEGYLATTPGGIFAVLATAVGAGVDVTFVMAVQVLRVIVMLLVAPVIARVVARHRS